MRTLAFLSVLVLLCLQVRADDELAPTQASGSGEADSNQTLIATVFGEPLYLEAVTPEDAEAKRKELPPDEFDRWLREYRGRRTYEQIWHAVLRRYVEREQISVTDAELAAIAETVERRLQAEEVPPEGITFTPDERKGIMVAWARGSLMDWKICRSLYKEFGGRVGIGSLGAWTAFDGQNALIREYHQSGEIRFYDAEVEEAVWEHTKITNFADAYPEGDELKRLLDTPPYLLD